jgi:hypothetical protein
VGSQRRRGSQLLLTGQHDRTPVTTKHEKKVYANHLFGVSLRLFSREAITLVESWDDDQTFACGNERPGGREELKCEKWGVPQ